MAILVYTLWFFAISMERQVDPRDMVEPSGFLALIFLFFVVFPQLSYKPRERWLEVSETDLDTRIGSITGHRGWKDIASIDQREGYIAVVVAGGIWCLLFWIRTRNGNAFVIPDRAFPDAAAKERFLKIAHQFLTANAVKYPRLSSTRYYG